MEEELLKEYVSTYLNPKYNSDWDVINSKFPELSGVDKEILKEYVATYLNPKYNGDWNVVNSKFPELNISAQPSTILKKKEDTTALPSGLGSSVSSVSAKPEMAKFGYQPGKPLPEQIPSVQPDQPVQPKYTEEVMFGPMGISGVKTTGRAQEFEGKSIPNVVGELGKTFGKGIVKFPADILETAAIAAAAAKNVAAKTGIVDETSAFNVSLPFGGVNVNFFQAAGEWKDLVDGFVPTDKDIEDGFWGQTANALGQMVPILLTGGMSGGAKAIAKEAGKKGLSMQAVANYGKNVVSRIGTPQGAITISQVAAPSYEQAKLEGATENEALGYAIQNAVMTFPLEMLPVNNLFKRLDNVLVGNTGVEVLKRAVVGGGEELITEGVQAVYENVTADAIYGTTRGFLDGVGEAAAVGGTVGAIMNGVLTALLGRRARAKSDKEIEEIDKSIKDVEQKIAQVESNNESINETVKVLEETKLRKLSYGSADYNFIESPEGALEYADDALTEQQAQGIVGNLANSYKKIDFTIEEVEPEDPYQPTTYKIIGTPKTIQQDAIQEQAAGQVPVQSGATVSQEVAQGEPQAEPQVTAEAGVQEEVGSGVFDLKEIGKNIKQDDLIRFQELSESLREGELLLKDNVDASGNKLTAEKRLQIEKSVESTKRKIQSLSSQKSQVQEVASIIESAKNSLGKRLSGDQLLNSQDLIDELNDNKAKIDEDGMVTVYHRTTPENKAEIEKTGKMKGLEDGVFFSTTETGQSQGYGDAIVKLKVPVEQLTLDDTFGDEAHLRIPTTKAGQVVNVKEYLQIEPQVQEEVTPKLELTDDQIVEYNPTEEISDKNIEVLLKVFQSKKFEPTAEPIVTDLGDSVVFEYNNFDDTDENARSWFIFKKKKDGSITGNGVKVEKNRGNLRNTQFFRNYVNSKRAELAAQPEVTTKPTVSPAVSAQEEVVTPQVPPARKETFEELMEKARIEGEAIEAETKDFNSKNEREYTGRKDKSRIKDDIIKAEYDVFYAKKRIGSADDVEAAVNEYNKAKEKVSELEEEINQLDNFNDVNNLISQEIEDSKKPDYEYRELFKKDPRLASIQSYNSLIDFLKTIDGKDDSISLYERFIKNLKEDIKKYPIKKQVSPTSEKKAVSPTVSPKPAAKKSTAQNKRDEIISRPAFTPIALARQWLLLGGKLLPKQSEENKRRGVGVGKGVQEETGMSGIEIRALGDVTDNKRGISIEMAAGKIWQGLSPELQASMDDTDIRNAMIDILMSENRKSWIENQDRDTSEDDQSLAREEFEYAQLTEQERADFDEYQQEQSYSNYLEQNAKRLAKEYDAYIKSKTYQDYIEETYERDRQGQNNAQNKNDRRGKKQGSDAGTAPVQGREQAAKTPEVEAVINEDTGTLESALDFLDGLDKTIDKVLKTRANDALLGIPLTALQGIVKGLKALVQGGMKLRDAIKRIAEENNISQDKLKELLDLGAIAKEFNEVMARADKLIARQKSKNIDEKKILTNLETKLRKEPVYINATDAQRKIMEREVRAKIGVQPRKAASIGRVIGALKDITNVTREEKLKIIGRIRELGRDVAKDLTAEIRAMAKGGTITPNQSADIIARFGKVNMLNEKSVSNFVDYMAKVFANAEYASQLKSAISARKRLKSLSKNKDKAANLKTLASKFAEIDPTMVEDIYEYNKLAKMIEQSVAGSSIKGKDVKFANIVQEGDVMPYINKTLEAQRKKLFDEKLKEVQDILGEIKDILGIDAKDLSYEDLLAILSETDKKSKGKDNDKLVRDAINKAFDVYSSIIKSIIKTGTDPFSGQEVIYTDAQKKIISDFMDMDLNIIPTPQALEAVDAALNFLQNKSTAKMEAIFKAYMGEKNARELVEKGVKASPLRKYWSKGLGRFFGEQTTNLGILFERLFKGFEAGGVVQDAMGLTDLINGKSQAQNESNRIINDYVNEFYKKKANNEAFNTELNNVERGMAAWMMRNIIGTEAQMKVEFKRRKDLIKESIKELGNGNEKEVAKSLVYQDVYDKILKDANSIDDVIAKVDAVNLDAVKFWQDQWQNKYDELADVSLNVYNKVLEKDINYTPDKYGRLSANTETIDITENDMAFNVNNGTLYEKETGVLIEATRPDPLPVDRFIDLSFDSNNANSMYDALVDIKTAGPIRQVKAFLNSKSFKKIFPKAEDALILKGSKKNNRIGRIELFTRNFRNKNPYSEDEFSSAVRNLNRLANVGVSQALGGIFQPIKQVIPAGMNTLINGGGLDIDAMTNPDKIKFMMDSGYAIGFRGVESQAQVESLNRLMDMAAKSKGAQAMKYIEEANKMWLKVFLVKPDVFIARASWMTYYEQSLGKQGIDANGIDYSTHKINEEAANYAQRMVDRQQNVSDADLSGKLFSEKNPGKQIMMKMFMPFASFRMNQSARLGADIATITSKVSTQEDRKIAARSLAGFGVEMVTFRALSLGISLLTASVVASMMGSEEEDEEKKKKSIMKGQATNTVSDILSPIPFTDPIIQAIAATTLQSAQDIAGVDEEEMISLFSPQDKGYLEQIGLFGFAAQRVVQTGELVWMSTVGHYRDDFGKKKYVSDEDKEALRLLIGPALLTNIGLAPSEMNSVVRASVSAAKKNSSTKEGGSTSGKDYESQMLDIMEEDLLEGYENKTDLKRYNPRLYEQNFGEGSEYYELTKEKREEQKKLDEEEQKEKDAEYGYTGKGKGFGSRSKSSGKGFGAKKFGKD